MARKKVAGPVVETLTTTTKRTRTTVKNPFDSNQPKSKTTRATHVTDVHITPKTEPQRQMIESYMSGLNIFAMGSAGTGKSYVALYLALRDLLDAKVSKIVIVRSAVQTRDIGYLPGSLEEKTEVYSIPYRLIVNQLMKNDTMWDIMTKKGLIQFMTTSFIRGITIDDAVVIFDESQNADYTEISSTISRSGDNTRFIACGDTKQSDMERHREKSGLSQILKVIEKMPDWFDIVTFLPQDIVRSGLVKSWILAEEQLAA